MAMTGNVEISNKGLRFVHVDGPFIRFAYEDGRRVMIEFTSSRRAWACYRDNFFIPTGHQEPESFHFYGVVEVTYLQPEQK